jgi:5'-nucleotidase, C-terminal domain
MKMNLRNALCTLLVLGLSVTLAAGQQGEPVAADSSAKGRDNTASHPAQVAAHPANLKIFFTGYLLGYYRLPQWQDDDFEDSVFGKGGVPDHESCPDVEQDNKKWKAELNLSSTGSTATPAWHLMDALQNGVKDEHGTLIEEPKTDNDILVGMGDNFGVTLESRVYRQQISDQKLWQLFPKSRDPQDQWQREPDPTQSPYPIGDNVGCFLSRAGYDAIVPGKDDFYFGPERLRRIADRLAVAPHVNGLHPVRMLAANLVLKTDYLPGKKPPAILDSDKKSLKFLPGLPADVKSLDASDNGVLLPFTRQLRFQFSSSPSALYSGDSFRPFLCSVEAPAGLDALNPEICDTSDNSPPPWPRVKEAAGSAVWDFDLPKWSSNLPALYGLCIKGDPSDRVLQMQKRDYYCLRLTVAEPLFGKSETEPYVVKKLPRADGTDAWAVIVGIVDKDLTALVGRDNLSWRNNLAEAEPENGTAFKTVREGKETYSTSVDTMDPATTIGFALRHFDLVGRKAHGIPKNAKPIKILLAQMDRGKTETLAGNLANVTVSTTRLNFDVVLSSATDFSAATANERVTLDLPNPVKPPDQSAKKTLLAPEFRQFVVAPWRAYDGENSRLPNPLRILTLSDSACDKESCKERAFRVGGAFAQTFNVHETVNAKDLEANYDGMGRTYLTGKGYWPPDSTSPQQKTLNHPFVLATLDVLRTHTGADIAMLQKRDFYWGPFSPTLNPSASTQPSGELLDRILWMGNYLQFLTVKGDTLKKVLDDSDKLDALDAQVDNLALETLRGLLTLGIQKTQDKQYLVAGTILDPNRLYTVATSNHISAGDTGYPELADPQFAEATLPQADKSERISFLVCRQLGGESCGPSLTLLFATIQPPQLPSQLEPPISARVNAWTRQLLYGPRLLKDGNSFVDYRAQLNPTWRLSLKDFSFNLSGVRNNLSEIERSTELAGVAETSASNPKGHALDYSAHAEFVRTAQKVDWFLRGLTVYKATATANTQTLSLLPGQTTPPTVGALPVVSRSKNQGAIDAGFFVHNHDKHDNRYGFILEPFHFDSPLHSVDLPVNAYYSRTTDQLINPAFTLGFARNRRYLSRLALRAESSKSSFEAGIQGGWEQNALQQLTDNVGINCLEAGNVNLSSCLKGVQQTMGFDYHSLHPLYGTRENSGAYVNLDWTVPLIWKLSVHTEDYGEYYRPAHLDNSTNTLYRNDSKETLKFTVLPNLTFGPGLERFDYENKIEHVHLRTWDPVFNVTYSFDKYAAGSWNKSLGYSPNAAAAK